MTPSRTAASTAGGPNGGRAADLAKEVQVSDYLHGGFERSGQRKLIRRNRSCLRRESAMLYFSACTELGGTLGTIDLIQRKE